MVQAINKSRWLIVTVMLGAVCAGTIFAQYVARPLRAEWTGTVPTRSSEQAVIRSLLPLPEEWVAFSARVRVFYPGIEKASVAVGRKFRRSDGSLRTETGPTEDDMRIIDIRNIRTQQHYLYTNGKWEVAPVQLLEPGVHHPPKRFADDPNLVLYHHSLSFAKGQVPSVFASTGFRVYRYVDGGGNLRLQAPSLNMLDLVTQSITGTREETFDIELGEPADALFEPPAGVDMRVVTEPRGLRYLEGSKAPAQPMPGMHKP